MLILKFSLTKIVSFINYHYKLMNNTYKLIYLHKLENKPIQTGPKGGLGAFDSPNSKYLI